MRILMRRAQVAAAAAVLAGLLGFSGWMWAVSWRPKLSDFPVQGVDVSEADGPIDWWAARRSGTGFVYAIATAGAGHRDLRFPENWRGAFEAGLERGAIHVYSLCQLATDQAGNFVSTVARTDEQLSPAVLLDFEPSCSARPQRNVLVGELRRFIAAVETHTGHRMILKIASRFEAQYRISDAIDRPLWTMGFLFPPAYLARPWTMWQASPYRRVEGAGEPLNWDVMAR
jgi:lysozyme